MKKALSLLLAVVTLFGLCACGGVSEEAQETPVSVEKLTQLTAENTLVIEGDEYALPLNAQELIDAGWTGAFADHAFAPNEGGTYPSLSFKKDGKTKIKGAGFFNHTEKSASLDKCAVISLTLIGKSTGDSNDTCSFTLPGGITEKSKYQEVIAAYSGKYKISDSYATSRAGEYFEKYGFSVMFRAKDETSSYNYNFHFNADLSIKTVEIESANYKSSALAAFDK